MSLIQTSYTFSFQTGRNPSKIQICKAYRHSRSCGRLRPARVKARSQRFFRKCMEDPLCGMYEIPTKSLETRCKICRRLTSVIKHLARGSGLNQALEPKKQWTEERGTSRGPVIPELQAVYPGRLEEGECRSRSKTPCQTLPFHKVLNYALRYAGNTRIHPHQDLRYGIWFSVGR